MSEERDTAVQPNESTQKERTVTPGQQLRRKRSVFQYIAVMFAAAFVLLLFTFLMERRQYDLLRQQDQEQIDNLQQSVSAVQSLQNLYDENDALKQAVEDLNVQIAALETSIYQLESSSGALSAQLDKTICAMDWFWQINEAYSKGKYSLCRSLIQSLEDNTQGQPLKDFLPTESITDNGRFSPAERYQEIYDAVY